MFSMIRFMIYLITVIFSQYFDILKDIKKCASLQTKFSYKVRDVKCTRHELSYVHPNFHEVPKL